MNAILYYLAHINYLDIYLSNGGQILNFLSLGGGRDYVLVGSDSGRIVILEFNNDKNRFERVHQETFGRSGCRRIVPGQVRTDATCTYEHHN